MADMAPTCINVVATKSDPYRLRLIGFDQSPGNACPVAACRATLAPHPATAQTAPKCN